jgi:hypothetical protein
MEMIKQRAEFLSVMVSGRWVEEITSRQYYPPLKGPRDRLALS